MKINIWAERHDKYDIASNYVAIYNLVDKWIKSYPNIVFERKLFIDVSERKNIDKYPIEYRKLIHNGHNSVFYFIIENEETKKYFLISYWDCINSVDLEYKYNHYDIENMVELFSAQGGQKPHSVDYLSFEETEVKYTPINKVVWLVETELEIQNIMSLESNYKQRILPDKLFFRVGDPYGFRTALIKDPRFNSKYGARVSERQHVQELNKYSINMDVYSVSGVNMRLIEGMGLGTAVLSPNFPQKHHNPIIPDYHYVKVEFDESYLNLSNYLKLADSYIETFEALKKDPDKIVFISNNAREYYLKNCTIEKHVDLLYDLLDLNKLN